MDYMNSNNNNNSKLLNAQKPVIPCKPEHLKNVRSKEHKVENFRGKLTKSGSVDHVTPKIWTNRLPLTPHTRRSELLPGSLSLNELPESRFTQKWQPVSRPKTSENKNIMNLSLPRQLCNVVDENEKQSNVNESKEQKLSHGDPQSNNNDSSSLLNCSESVTNSTLPKNVVGDVGLGNCENLSKIKYRQSFMRDPRSPGFGTIKRMWDVKSDNTNISPKSAESSVDTKIKQRSVTVASTSSQQNIDNSTSLKNTTFELLSPKPFQSSFKTSNNCYLHGQVVDETSNFQEENTAPRDSEKLPESQSLQPVSLNHKNLLKLEEIHDQNACVNNEAQAETALVSGFTNLNMDMHDSLENSNSNSANTASQNAMHEETETANIYKQSDLHNVVECNDEDSTVGSPVLSISESFPPVNSTTIVPETGIYQGGDFEENVKQPSLEPHDYAACYSTGDDNNDSADEPPEVPPRDHSLGTHTVYTNTDDSSENCPNYLPMTSSVEPMEQRYVDMTNETKVEHINYNSTVPPPSNIQVKKSKREYHEIDPNVPPPPDRDPPKLPSIVKEKFPTSSYAASVEDDEPPPLPPDNTVGRRSMMYSKEKKRQVVQDLQENIAKSSKGKPTKRLNYIEVTANSSSTNKPSHKLYGRTNYSDVVVPPENEYQHRDRSGSGTSEEGLSTTPKKKQKKVKEKLQSLFSKEEPKSNQTKEQTEILTDFDKERNKKKRISGRFIRKKRKDDTKNKKERYSDGGSSKSYEPETAIYVDSESVSMNTSLDSVNATSSTAIVSSNGSSHSSGDGEVTRKTVPSVPSHYKGGDDNARVEDSPLELRAKEVRRRSEQHPASIYPVPKPRGEIYKKSHSHGHIESTFQAYPPERPTSGEMIAQPKVSSYLHGGANPKTTQGALDHRTEPSLRVNKRLSAPLVADPDHSQPITPESSHSNSKTKASRIKSSPIPLPGMAVLPQPYKTDPASEATASVSPELSRSFLHPDNVSGLRSDETDSLYTPAEDVIPPPLPPRGRSPSASQQSDSFYDSISPLQVVPSPYIGDTSKFLYSEPLYQIYRSRTLSHASAKRKASVKQKEKSSSDRGSGQETWESGFKSEDLGTSTLWRSIPEVIKSGIVEKLSREELKLQQAQFEVITSQASYLRSLNILVEHFMKDWAMQSTDILPAADSRHLFSNVETVCDVEKKFLQELENHFWNDIKLTKVCALIDQYAQADFKVYILYIQNQVYQDRVLTKLQSMSKYEKFAEELGRLESSPACNKLPLHSFLMLPMQRVTRLPLLVTAIVNAADSAGDTKILNKAKRTLGVVNKLVKRCNEGARKMQQTEQLAEIASQLDYAPSIKMYALVSQSRSLVKKGELNVNMSIESKKTVKTAKFWLFLFTDVLLITRKKGYIEVGGSTPRYEVIDWANRQYLTVNKNAVTDNAIFLVILENQAKKRVEMTLMPLAQNELSRWENALNPPSQGGTGESIYETWDCPQYTCVVPYVAQQPDELSLEVGDVMQVLKKTSDGWLEGERLRDGESGWFPSHNCDEIDDEHVRSRNMKNLYRTLAA